MKPITMYTTAWCGFCVRAKLHDLTGGWTVPQIVIGGSPIGGYSELRELDRAGRLDELVAA